MVVPRCRTAPCCSGSTLQPPCHAHHSAAWLAGQIITGNAHCQLLHSFPIISCIDHWTSIADFLSLRLLFCQTCKQNFLPFPSRESCLQQAMSTALPQNPRHKAAYLSDLSKLKQLVSTGPFNPNELDEQKRSLLFYACRAPNPSLELVLFLLEEGADPNILSTSKQIPANLLIASLSDRLDSTHDFDCDEESDATFQTLLNRATLMSDIFQALSFRGADLTYTLQGNTPQEYYESLCLSGRNPAQMRALQPLTDFFSSWKPDRAVKIDISSITSPADSQAASDDPVAALRGRTFKVLRSSGAIEPGWTIVSRAKFNKSNGTINCENGEYTRDCKLSELKRLNPSLFNKPTVGSPSQSAHQSTPQPVSSDKGESSTPSISPPPPPFPFILFSTQVRMKPTV
jgi:hypothetical protein